jgi:RimJ/RimL family protein N-acetyltransferase
MADPAFTFLDGPRVCLRRFRDADFARRHQGKGYASEAVRLLLHYAFDTLGKHRMVAITDAKNAPSIALLERLGMRREGHFIQNVWFKGAWGDECLYAMLRDEWLRAAVTVTG